MYSENVQTCCIHGLQISNRDGDSASSRLTSLLHHNVLLRLLTVVRWAGGWRVAPNQEAPRKVKMH